MFENKTTLNKKTMGFLADLSIKSPRVNLFRIIFGIAAIIFAGIAYRSLGEPKSYCFMTLTLLCLVLAIWGLGAMLKSKIMKAANMGESRIYEIDDSGITVTIPVAADQAAWNKLNYSKLSHVVEGKDAIAIRLVDSDAFLVLDKGGFTKGTAQEALSFLGSKGLSITRA